MGNNEEKRDNDDKEKISQRERDELEDTVMRSYKKTKVLLEEMGELYTKLGYGELVQKNNSELEDSIYKFRKILER